MLKHDVSYVLVIAGALIQYSGDDLNKFLWMIRIASGVWPDEIQEADFFSARGEFRIDDMASKAMKESIMYKMSYYRSVPFRPLALLARRMGGAQLTWVQFKLCGAFRTPTGTGPCAESEAPHGGTNPRLLRYVLYSVISDPTLTSLCTVYRGGIHH